MSAWRCPLNHSSECDLPHVIGLDGGLRHVPMTSMLIEKGWKMVNWPRRAYFMEFDQTHPAYKERQKIQMAEESNMLDVEVV